MLNESLGLGLENQLLPPFLLAINRDGIGEVNHKSLSNFFSDDRKGFRIENRISSKFKEDQIFYQNNRFLFVFDGVLLNNGELFGSSKFWKTAFLDEYERSGDNLICRLRGSFIGCVYDKHKDEWVVFSDHIGSKPLFYCTLPNSGVIIGSSLSSVIKEAGRLGKKATLNLKGAYLLLTYGYMVDDTTLVNEIVRLKPGTFLKINSGGVHSKVFYKIRNKDDNSLTPKDALIESDRLFKQAIARAFEKDKTYGYQHIASLSGGLDSRMTVMVAHAMGYSEQLNLTFSESDYLDQTIPMEIARDLQHQWLFKALDNGLFLSKIDETSLITEGRVLYSGAAHSNSLYELINFDQLGMLHTGQLGDSVIACSSLPQRRDSYVGNKTYSNTLLSSLDQFDFDQDYENDELYFFYNRAFSGANSGLVTIQQKTETYSPFYDVDYLDFCLKIPSVWKLDHQLYKRWVVEMYPDAAKYIWEKTRTRIDSSTIRIRGKSYYVSSAYRSGLSRISNFFGQSPKRGMDTRKHMNPLDYWYRNNNGVRGEMDQYFLEHLDLIVEANLKQDCKALYMKGRATEKVQVLSLLSALKTLGL